MFYGVDFGANDALAAHGPDGPVTLPRLPRVPGGASVSDKFIRTLPILLETGHVVVESATVGASGVEPDEVAKVVESAPNRLFTVSCRAVKNHRKDHGMTWDKGARYAKEPPDPTQIDIHLQENVHATDAAIIYTIAVEQPQRLRMWAPNTDVARRRHTSVRPHDKRNYRGEIPDYFMSRLPRFDALPADLQQMLGNAVGTPRADYSRAKAMPFAMALDEVGTDTRDGYEKILGMYEHGFPSFYRRAVTVLGQQEAKRLADVTRIEEVPRGVRIRAQRNVRRNLRHLWHLMQP